MSLKELGELVRTGETIKIKRGDKEVDINVREFSLKHIPQLSSVVGIISQSASESKQGIAKVILENVDKFYLIVSLSIDEEVQVIQDSLTVDEFVEVALKVVEVNMNLFLEKILPKVEGLDKRLAKMTAGQGLSKG